VTLFYVAWFAWAVFVILGAALIVPPIINSTGGLIDRGLVVIGVAKPRFTIRPHEETEWGTMFAIVDPKGEVVGLDRYAAAKQRCAALNEAS
jgi:hypothetical protein